METQINTQIDSDYRYGNESDIIDPHQPNPTEVERLNLLYELNILDTKREAQFDALTALGNKVFKTPICLISLLDSERQWFKSFPGLNCCETPRKVAFCNITVHPQAGRVTVVKNPQVDPRFKNNALVTGYPHIRFYAGAPIFPDPERNVSIGSFCVIDTKRRTDFGKHEEDVLIQMAALCAELMHTTDRNLSRKSAIQKKMFSFLSHKLNNPIHVILNSSELLTANEGKGVGLQAPSQVLQELQAATQEVVTMIEGMKNLDSIIDKPFSSEFLVPHASNVVTLASLFRDLFYLFNICFDPFVVQYRFSPELNEVTVYRYRILLERLLRTIIETVFLYGHFTKKEMVIVINADKSGDMLILSVSFPVRQNLKLQTSSLEKLLATIDPDGELSMIESSDELELRLYIGLNKFDEVIKAEGKPSKKMRIADEDKRPISSLMVIACDDEPLVRLLLKRMLLKVGFSEGNIHMFTDCDEVLEFIIDRKEKKLPMPDIGFFDIIMKRLNGDVGLKKIHELGVDFPVCAATACSTYENLVEYGFKLIIRKPYKWESIQDSLKILKMI